MSEIRAPDERVKPRKDLTGMQFGRLTVVEQGPDHIDPHGVHLLRWKCVCECGGEALCSTYNLEHGITKSCGCLRLEKTLERLAEYNAKNKRDEHVRVLHDLTGQRFGRLTVIRQADDYIAPSQGHYAVWECQCDCGNLTTVIGTRLTRGIVLSCGCYQAQRSAEYHTKHNGCKDRLYRIWCAMRERCNRPLNKAYASYGGRGIRVCEEWDKDYQAFRDWALINGYDPTAPFGQCTIERIDVDGDYCPENCTWISLTEQQKNKRKKKEK